MAPSIPVRLINEQGQLLALDANIAVLHLPANTGHGHKDGTHCPGCAARTDVRALLFNLHQEAQQGLRAPFNEVVVDASALDDAADVVAALSGKLPAQALRDHAVARLFYLAD